MVYLKHNNKNLLLLLFLLQNALLSTSFTPVGRSINRNHVIQAAVATSTRTNTINEGNDNDGNKMNVYDTIKNAQVINPSSEKINNALDGISSASEATDPVSALLQNIFSGGSSSSSSTTNTYDYLLVIVMPQLGDFDSAEYAELLSAVQQDLVDNKIALRIIGLGDTTSAKRFANFSGLKLDSIRVDPKGSIHNVLKLHRGPDWDVPSFIPNSLLEWFADYCGAEELDNGTTTRDAKAITRSWLNYMAMCAGLYAPDTLPEILRGYFGDKDAPERLRSDDIITVPATNDGGVDEDGNEPFIEIKGITDVKVGPIKYQSLWKNEKGYQRPAELATIRLRFMVEVLSNFGTYVPDQRFLDFRGATYLFGGELNDQLIYEHIDTGVLSYSKTMKRPLSFLEPYIGEKALNPLGLGDPAKTN